MAIAYTRRLERTPWHDLWTDSGIGWNWIRGIRWGKILGASLVTSSRLPKAKLNLVEEKPRVRRIGSLVSQLMSRRGYAQVAANEALQRVIEREVGQQLSDAFRVGNLRQGVLQVYATDSVTMQELNFRKRAILKRIQAEAPDSKITDLRFRVQS